MTACRYLIYKSRNRLLCEGMCQIQRIYLRFCRHFHSGIFITFSEAIDQKSLLGRERMPNWQNGWLRCFLSNFILSKCENMWKKSWKMWYFKMFEISPFLYRLTSSSFLCIRYSTLPLSSIVCLPFWLATPLRFEVGAFPAPLNLRQWISHRDLL